MLGGQDRGRVSGGQDHVDLEVHEAGRELGEPIVAPFRVTSLERDVPVVDIAEVAEREPQLFGHRRRPKWRRARPQEADPNHPRIAGLEGVGGSLRGQRRHGSRDRDVDPFRTDRNRVSRIDALERPRRRCASIPGLDARGNVELALEARAVERDVLLAERVPVWELGSGDALDRDRRLLRIRRLGNADDQEELLRKLPLRGRRHRDRSRDRDVLRPGCSRARRDHQREEQGCDAATPASLHVP